VDKTASAIVRSVARLFGFSCSCSTVQSIHKKLEPLMPGFIRTRTSTGNVEV